MGGYSMKLQIITPFSRTRENIGAIYSSLKSVAAQVETEWIIVYQYDAGHELMEWHRENEKQQILKVTMLRGNTATSYYGHSYRNQALHQLRDDRDSWVYFIDDDNIVHPDFPKLLNALLPDDEVVFFSQVWKNREMRLEPSHIGVGGVDTAMILARSAIMKQYSWNEEEYTADGLIAEKLAANHRCRRIFEPYCFYNYLR